MSGTSLDGLDVALVRIHDFGLALRAEFMLGHSVSLDALGADLQRLARQAPATAGEIAVLAHDFALLHVRAIAELGQRAGIRLDASTITLVAAHGQTVFHAPPHSWQLMNPAPLAAALGVPVVFDLRAADLAAGGQGAPITPLADAVLFGDPGARVAVVNLGGFANFTLLPRWAPVGAAGAAALAQIDGGDLCLCNQLLDALARRRLDRRYDEGGAVAAQGRVDARALQLLRARLDEPGAAGGSLGTAHERGDECAALLAALSAPDALRTACRAIAEIIAARLVRPGGPQAASDHRTGVQGAGCERLLLAGGGARNGALVSEIGAASGRPAGLTDAVGIPVEYREAIAMAVLGALCADGVPITLPRVTKLGCPAPPAGAWVGRVPGAPRRVE